MLFWEFLIVLLLILMNGFFAMSELAIVSSRRVRLEQMAQAGRIGASKALALSQDPTGFLSTVQIGITLIGIFAGAYSGATFADPLAGVLSEVAWIDRSAYPIALTLVVLATTYLSLIVGELVPKRIALNNAEAIACFVAGPMSVVAVVATPVVWFLRLSTETVLRLIGAGAGSGSTVTEEEVKAMIAEGTETGVFEHAEREMIEGVLTLADRNVRSMMVPRRDVVWLSVDEPPEAILDRVRASGHSRFPVCRGDLDDLVGVLRLKDLLGKGGTLTKDDILAAVVEPLYVNETMPALKLLDRFRGAKVHMAIVLDEYGAFEGVVTANDILSTITGDLPERAAEADEPEAVQRADGSWLLEASMPIVHVGRFLPGFSAEEGPFATLAGFVLEHLGHIPVVGESFDAEGWRFEVVDLDGRRIDKLLATKLPADEEE